MKVFKVQPPTSPLSDARVARRPGVKGPRADAPLTPDQARRALEAMAVPRSHPHSQTPRVDTHVGDLGEAPSVASVDAGAKKLGDLVLSLRPADHQDFVLAYRGWYTDWAAWRDDHAASPYQVDKWDRELRSWQRKYGEEIGAVGPDDQPGGPTKLTAPTSGTDLAYAVLPVLVSVGLLLHLLLK